MKKDAPLTLNAKQLKKICPKLKIKPVKNFVIREFKDKDFDTGNLFQFETDILNSLDESKSFTKSFTVEQIRDSYRYYLGKGYRIFLATFPSEDNIIASMRCYTKGNTMHMSSIIVNPKCQRKHVVGPALVVFFFIFAYFKGFEFVTIDSPLPHTSKMLQNLGLSEISEYGHGSELTDIFKKIGIDITNYLKAKIL